MRRIHQCVMLTGVLALAGQAVAQDVLREAVGDRAAALAKMELKPFDATLWSSLSEWANGQALDTAATDGKVVLIATWASWNPAAKRAISTIQDLKEEYADQGLIVVGVHHPTGWDKAAESLERRKADFLIAHDSKGKFREGIQSDQDPDFYLIDRAGQLRYADIRTESVAGAVKELLAEDAASAGSLSERLAAEAKAREAELRRPQAIREGVNLSSMPEVPFVAPTEVMYQLAAWPERKTDDDNRRGNRDENSGPRQMGVPGSGWLDGEPPKTDGRAVVYYSWVLDDPNSVALTRQMDTWQRQFGRDVVIVGVCIGVRVDDNRGRNDDERVDPATIVRRVAQFRKTHGVEHPMMIDDGGNMFGSNGGGGRNEVEQRAIVVSSDSMVRWEGSDFDGFRAALNKVIDVDPGIRARRAAEEAYIRSRQGG